MMPTDYGGLGAFDPVIRCQAILASWIPRVNKARDELATNPDADVGPWFYLFEEEHKRLDNLLKSKWKMGEKKALTLGFVAQTVFYYNKAQKNNHTGKALDSVKSIHNALLPTPEVQPILGQKLPDEEAKSRWKWITTMPVSGKAHDLRWHAWHHKLILLYSIPLKANLPCVFCGEPNSDAHILNTCYFALSCRHSIASLGAPW